MCVCVCATDILCLHKGTSGILELTLAGEYSDRSFIVRVPHYFDRGDKNPRSDNIRAYMYNIFERELYIRATDVFNYRSFAYRCYVAAVAAVLIGVLFVLVRFSEYRRRLG